MRNYEQVFVSLSTTREKREKYNKICKKMKLPVGTRIKELIKEADNFSL